MNFLHDMDWVLPLRSDNATVLADAFTWLGYSTFFLIALPLIYWLWDRTIATRLVVLIAITAAINGWLKDYWQDPRPPHNLWLDNRIEGSFGRPSGHAQVAFAMWAWLAYEIKKPWAWVAAILIIGGVCASRLYLAVHDIDDILTGLSLGILGMLVFIWLQTSTFFFVRNLPTIGHLILIVAVGAILFLTWPNGHEASHTVGVLALLFGWFVGTDMDHRLAPNAPQLPGWLGRGVMAVVGIVVLFAIQIALTKITIALGLGGVTARYTALAILGVYATGIAPMGFRALRLVK